jgi:hypothetical protein
MPKITLTDFVDIVSLSGTQKANKVKEIKRRGDYDHKLDFWRPLREELVQVHSRNHPKKSLPAFPATMVDKKKQANYSAVITGYTKWWGNKSLVWFPPPSTVYTAHGVDVSVKPELGLEINGTRHIVKLYLKAGSGSV